MYISNYLKLGVKGHSNFEFVDVFLNSDNRLFLDPCLIERGSSHWDRKAVALVDSFFDELYKKIRLEETSPRELFAHAHEQNATKLGYGNGQNGKGKTAEGLDICLQNLYDLARAIPTISRAQDIPVLIEGFAEDCMSDLLTNILHEHLNSFTASQMEKYNRKPDGEKSFFTWNDKIKCWEKVARPCWLHKGKELLLVPKWIVRKNFLFGVRQYLNRVILERIRDENGWHDTSKKDIRNNLPRNSEHWEYEAVVDYTKEHPDTLNDYHKRLPSYYGEAGGCMTDEELDIAVYGYDISQSA